MREHSVLEEAAGEADSAWDGNCEVDGNDGNDGKILLNKNRHLWGLTEMAEKSDRKIGRFSVISAVSMEMTENLLRICKKMPVFHGIDGNDGKMIIKVAEISIFDGNDGNSGKKFPSFPSNTRNACEE